MTDLHELAEQLRHHADNLDTWRPDGGNIIAALGRPVFSWQANAMRSIHRLQAAGAHDLADTMKGLAGKIADLTRLLDDHDEQTINASVADALLQQTADALDDGAATVMPDTRADNTPARATLNAEEAAKMLGIGTRTLWTLTNSGQVPHARLEGRVVYTVEALTEYLRKVTTTDATTKRRRTKSSRKKR